LCKTAGEEMVGDVAVGVDRSYEREIELQEHEKE
jgi:hypothetical protein